MLVKERNNTQKLKNDYLDKILLEYLEDRATPGDVKAIQRWLDEDPGHLAIFEKTKAYWEKSHPSVRSQLTDEAYNRIISKIATGNQEGTFPLRPQRQRSIFPHWMGIAASVILFVSIIGTVYFLLNKRNVPTTPAISQGPQRKSKGPEIARRLA